MTPEYVSSTLAQGSVNGLITNEGAGSWFTAIFKAPEAETPLESVRLTAKVLVPMSELAGVPERVPLAATTSQAGPLTFAKERVSPAGAIAVPAMVAE